MTRRLSPAVTAEQRRQYDAAALALFAAYAHRRSRYRPPQCAEQSPCWVTDGPPAMAGAHQRCLGCNGSPRLTAKPNP